MGDHRTYNIGRTLNKAASIIRPALFLFASPLVSADCTCPLSKKGQLCKHIWATLLTVADRRPDFLDGKEEIEKRTQDDSDSQQSEKKASKQKERISNSEYSRRCRNRLELFQ